MRLIPTGDNRIACRRPLPTSPMLVSVGASAFDAHARLEPDKLAESVGASFQQLQKYEKGSNRISSSRLSANR